jgi:capsular polysaccharide transport system permease protein
VSGSARAGAGPPGRIRQGAAVQARVVGALVMRELHTRFGRRNLGYLWLFLEPLLIGLLITLVVRAGRGTASTDIPPFDFFAVGTSLFFVFRSAVGRASGAIGSNTALLIHRQVAPVDFFYARHLLDAAATAFCMAMLVCGAVAVAGSPWPPEPLLMVGALFLILWLANGLAMLSAAACEAWDGVERVLHPLTLVLMPISGAFFLLAWMPPELRTPLAWNPTVHVFELLRAGQFGERAPTSYDLPYVIGWCMALNLLGLCALRVVRRRLGE